MSHHQPVGIRSIAVNFPNTVRTNDYWRQNYPELVTQAEQKSLAKVFSLAESALEPSELDIWSQEMKPYLSDPFRGATQRRVLSGDESSLTLEYGAAVDAIKSADLSPKEIDLMLVTSLFPEQISPGNATFLAGQLGLRGAAWNIESTCMTALASLQTACAMVRAGEYRNVLVVVSSTYSRFVKESDTISFGLGDGAGAFVVGELKAHQGILSTKIFNSSETCGAFFNEFTTDAQGNPRMFIQSGKNAGKVFRETTVKFVRQCCLGALDAAGLELEEIKLFAFNTPTAWYTNVCCRALGIDPSRAINLYSEYANIGPVLPIANLYHAAHSGKISENDLVLVYVMGFSANAAAIVMRWGDVALGSTPSTAGSSTKAMVGAPG